MKQLRLALQILLPLAVLAAGYLLATWILSNRKEPVVTPNVVAGPAVRTHTAVPTQVRIDVETNGTVEPFRSVELTAQVGGRIVAVSSSLRAGGFFAEGEGLVEIEAADFQFAIVQQEAAVARAELRLLQERAEADAAVRAWQELEGARAADPLVTRAPQIVDAEKAVAASKALLDRTRLDLDRTKVTAPFAGRVRSARAELGQTVMPGQPLAQIYDTGFAEVRLPIPAADAGFLDLPLHAGAEQDRGPAVELTTEFGGSSWRWAATIVRTEGEIDRRTRQLTVVARVAEPYARDGQSERPPLAVGMFVHARIAGRTFDDVIVIPRAALRPGNEVWIVGAENRLRRRTVDVLRAETDRVLLRSGIGPGDLVCITQLETPVDGMPVRPVAAAATTPPKGQ